MDREWKRKLNIYIWPHLVNSLQLYGIFLSVAIQLLLGQRKKFAFYTLASSGGDQISFDLMLSLRGTLLYNFILILWGKNWKVINEFCKYFRLIPMIVNAPKNPQTRYLKETSDTKMVNFVGVESHGIMSLPGLLKNVWLWESLTICWKKTIQQATVCQINFCNILGSQFLRTSLKSRRLK